MLSSNWISSTSSILFVSGSGRQAPPFRRGRDTRPDLVLPKHRRVVFVHGCFRHGHEHCPDFRLPKSRRAWRKAKIEANRARDVRHEAALTALGWHVVTIWACAVKTRAARSWLEGRIPGLVGRMTQ